MPYGADPDPRAKTFFQEAFLQCKTVAAWGKAVEVLSDFGVGPDAPGVVTAVRSTKDFAAQVVEAVGWHRHWARQHEM